MENEFLKFSQTAEYQTKLADALAEVLDAEVNLSTQQVREILARPTGYWNNAGIYKPAGMEMSISYAGGLWRSNPHWGPVNGAGNGNYIAGSSYLRPGAPEGCLIGKVGGNNSDGGSDTFALGNFGYIPASLEGLLWLTVNDEKRGFGDNRDSIWITVS